METEDLVKVKGSVGPSGASLDLRLNQDVPGVLGRLFPWGSARRKAAQVISTRILEKIERGEGLDFADAQYARDVFGEAEAKWIRRIEVARRASQTISSDQASVAALPAHVDDVCSNGASGDGKAPKSHAETSQDWINRFWDDAGLVSDEMLQELYGRVLASEAVRPGACSIRTLRVLRYLEKNTAENFGKLAALIYSNQWIPNEQAILDEYGVPYGMILDLDDAGFLDSAGLLSISVTSERPLFYYWDTRVLLIEDPKGLSFGIYPLTRAGSELARIAQVQLDSAYFLRVAKWIRSKKPSTRFAWAELPSRNWVGPINQLQWNELTEDGDAKTG